VTDRDQIHHMLQSPQEEDRLQGLRLLGRSDARTDLAMVCQALGDESWRIRKEAVQLFLSLPCAGELAGEVIELLHSEENAGLRNAAVEILVQLGYQVVPILVEELSCNDHDVRKFVLDILGDIGAESCIEPMLGALNDPDENVRAAAVENLGKLRAAESVTSLLAAMNTADLWLRFTILEALARIGQSVPVDSLLVFSGEKLLRKALFDCLGRIGGADAVPTLVAGLTDEMRNVRDAAVVGLDRIAAAGDAEVTEQLAGLAGSDSAQALGRALESPDLGMRSAAVRLLGRVRDVRFAPRLLALFDDELLRETAAATLIGMGREAACSLLQHWRDFDSRSRAYLVFILGESGCDEGYDLLLEALADADVELRVVAVQALGKLGRFEAVAPLVGALVDASDEVRDGATLSLRRLSQIYPEELVRELHPLLASEDAELRMHVVSVFGQMTGSEVAGCLGFAMKDESPLVRRAAVRACSGRPAGGELSTLMLALTDEDSEVRRLAVEALGTSGDQQAIAPLKLALQDDDIWVRAAAVRSLGRLGGGDVFTPVSQALADPVGLVAIAAMETLQDLDPVNAFPNIVRCLAHGDEEVVNAALNLLATSGRSEWLPAATDSLLNHRHWEVRCTFIRTLAGIQGAGCRSLLENRLLIEGEELVRHLIQDTLGVLQDIEE